ncbi:hypothetical protein [Chryseosolibacter indicus]|uniref:DUF1682 domain-containing protein n=1 Tax=Chryseosolibacter indicus TaxID=2782351 RepID=A0ABS5VX67_9BACT|nr:hypothetical protein [Chryseosolibacter indicus]MBT1705334.1 hypothetical protein [Chryseosolibacter indicus]
MNNKGLKIVKWVFVCVLFIVLFGYITMMLWNWLIPALFNGPAITFFQALGLLLLSKILFGGFGGKGCNNGPARWKHKYYEKLSSMNAEDRERFKARLREKWCSNDKNTSV